MKSVNRIRIAIAVSAALGLTALSSSASAQLGDPQECETLAWNTCHPDLNAPWNVWDYRCWMATYDACMGNLSSSAVAKPDSGDRRYEVQLASRSSPVARLG